MKLLRYQDLIDRGIVRNRTTLARWIDKHGFPKAVQLGPQSIAWREDEVNDWILSRTKAGNAEEA